jgi:hypothetical protein
VAGSCVNSIECSGLIKGIEFIDQLDDYQLLKKDAAPWSQ